MVSHYRTNQDFANHHLRSHRDQQEKDQTRMISYMCLLNTRVVIIVVGLHTDCNVNYGLRSGGEGIKIEIIAQTFLHSWKSEWKQ